MFALPEVLDYTAKVKSDTSGELLALAVKYRDKPVPESIRLTVEGRYPGFRMSVSEGGGFVTTGVLKRTIFIEH